MLKLRFKIVLAVAAIALTVQPLSEAGIPGVPGASPFATETTQLLNLAQLLAQVSISGKQLESIIGIQDQAGIDGTMQEELPFTDTMNDLEKIWSIANTGFEISYDLAQIDQAFGLMYPGFQYGRTPYWRQYNSWYQNTWLAIQIALQRAGINAAQTRTKQGFMQQLQFLAGSSAGRNQAIQIGNVAAIETVNSIDRLSAIFSSHMHAAASFNGYQLQQEQTRVDAASGAMIHVSRIADPREW